MRTIEQTWNSARLKRLSNFRSIIFWLAVLDTLWSLVYLILCCLPPVAVAVGVTGITDAVLGLIITVAVWYFAYLIVSDLVDTLKYYNDRIQALDKEVDRLMLIAGKSAKAKPTTKTPSTHRPKSLNIITKADQ